ncbi:glycosyltransferase [Candidatus Pacearchaeota archaeon]|nr:glycosyltransferase [Candidatus Pacearchaeota archaeon]
MTKNYTALGKNSNSGEQDAVLSEKPLKVGVVHYFWNESSLGVNTVVDNSIVQGGNVIYPNMELTFIGEEFKKGVFDEHDQRELPLFNSDSYRYLLGGLVDLTKDLDYIIIENPIRGINPYATKAFKEFTETVNKPVHWRNHDYIWDHKEDWNKFNKVFEHTQQAFPRTPNFSTSVLTSPAKIRMQKYYDKEINVIRNPIVCDNFYKKDDGKDEAFRELLEKEGIVDSGEKIISCPNRIVERKAIEVAFPIIRNLNEITGEKYKLLVTASIDGEKPYPQLNTYQRISEFVAEKHNIPVSLGEISKFIDGVNFNIGNLYHISDLALSPSEREGFGLGYIESQVSGTPMVGRYLTEVHPDFEQREMNFKHFYNDELIKSYGDKWVNRIQDIEHILSDKEAYKEFTNKLGIERRIEMANSVLEDNKRAVEKHYNHVDSARKIAKTMKLPGYEKLEEVK